LLIQKSRCCAIRSSLFGRAWVGGLWLEFTSPPHDWVTTAPTLHTPGTWSWVLIGVGTVIYAGIYLWP
jgi:hypothetical protein